MAIDTRASDWEFAGICQVGGAGILGGGAYMFMFRSETAGERRDVFFVGAGVGLGGSVGGASAPHVSTGEIPYSRITSLAPFSLLDLHNATGRIASAGVSALVGWSLTFATAVSSGETLFHNQGGFSGTLAAIGAGVTAFAGLWHVGSIGASHLSERGAEVNRELRRTGVGR